MASAISRKLKIASFWKLNWKQPNKKYLLDKLKKLAQEGMDFPSHTSSASAHVVPSKKTVKNSRTIINGCDDEDLNNWDVSLYANGSVLFNYYKRNGITAVVNVAELSASGIFAFRNMYDPVQVNMDEAEQIIDVFKKTRQYGGQ